MYYIVRYDFGRVDSRLEEIGTTAQYAQVQGIYPILIRSLYSSDCGTLASRCSQTRDQQEPCSSAYVGQNVPLECPSELT
jgi:hypothetical protein